MEIFNLKVYENGICRETTEEDLKQIELFEKRKNYHLSYVTNEMIGKIHLCEYCPIEKFMSCSKVRFGKLDLSFIGYVLSYEIMLEKERCERCVVLKCDRYSDTNFKVLRK